ncbi:MAG: hypothetical protein HW390_1771 [Candidatus Brocadiaceae bacterium]|nr:hypothetical protein [Candidatus Brocadiaceae bacterium]
MTLQIVLLFVGLVGLYYGAEWLVTGAARFAHALHIKPVVIGLTIVAFGTSMPELVTSVIAGIKHFNDIAVGNIVGSNIANIALILGLSAIVRPLKIDMNLLNRDMPVMIGCACFLYFISWDGVLSRWEGVALFVGIVAYTFYVYIAAISGSKAAASEHPEVEELIRTAHDGLMKDVILIIVGLVALVAGAHLLVHAAVYIAKVMGISELVIGLTVIAVGTSLPELATSVVASIRKQADISVGNIVGSNIFNILAVLGVAAMIQPILVNPISLRLDMPVMLFFSIFLVPIITWKFVISRLQGLFLLSGYGVYVYWLFK